MRRITLGLLLLALLSALPLAVAQDAPQPLAAQGGRYEVGIADTLDGIARAFDVSLVSLVEVNNLTNPLVIFPGDVLTIPADAPPYGQVPPLPGEPGPGPTAGGTIVVVQIGDYLERIAQRFDVRLDCLAEANSARIPNPNLIFPRTSLFVPDACPAYVPFNTPGGRLLPPDTGATVTQAQPTPTTTPQVPNPATPQIQPPVLATPTATPVAVGLALPATPSGGDVIVSAPAPLYLVERGDRLERIAAFYDIDVACLAAANGITNPDLIFVSQVLSVPTSACPPYRGALPVGVPVQLPSILDVLETLRAGA